MSSVPAGELTASSIVMQTPNQVAATIDEVTAIMSAYDSHYFLIDATGSAIWNRLTEPVRVSDLCAALVAEYEVAPDVCEKDVLAFLSDLKRRGLAQVTG